MMLARPRWPRIFGQMAFGLQPAILSGMSAMPARFLLAVTQQLRRRCEKDKDITQSEQVSDRHLAALPALLTPARIRSEVEPELSMLSMLTYRYA
jgi:hypothetical protein